MLIKKKSGYTTLIKATAIAVAFLLLFNDISFALSPEPGTQKALIKCEFQVLSWIRSGRLKFAETGEDVHFLKELNHADALLLSHGKILVDSNLKKDPLKLIRTITHEEIEAILQIMAREDRAKYSALINMVLSQGAIREKYYDLFSKGRRPDLPDELLANDILAKAFELLIPMTNGLTEAGQIAPAESEFLKTLEPLINTNKHNYFTGVFFDDSVRQQKIRVAMANGITFTQVASAQPEAPAPSAQVASSEPDMKDMIDEELIDMTQEELPLLAAQEGRARISGVLAELQARGWNYCFVRLNNAGQYTPSSDKERYVDLSGISMVMKDHAQTVSDPDKFLSGLERLKKILTDKFTGSDKDLSGWKTGLDSFVFESLYNICQHVKDGYVLYLLKPDVSMDDNGTGSVKSVRVVAIDHGGGFKNDKYSFGSALKDLSIADIMKSNGTSFGRGGFRGFGFKNSINNSNVLRVVTNEESAVYKNNDPVAWWVGHEEVFHGSANRRIDGVILDAVFYGGSPHDEYWDEMVQRERKRLSRIGPNIAKAYPDRVPAKAAKPGSSDMEQPEKPDALKVDTRPVEAELLHEAYVLNDMRIKTVVNPKDKPLRVLYGGAGADISNILLSTNATEMYFVSNYDGIRLEELRKLEDEEYLRGGYENDLDPGYASKFEDGHATGASLVLREHIVGALAFELHAMGATNIRVDTNDYRPRISFEWAYQGAITKQRSITLVDGNVTVPENYTNILSRGIDIYYQRAGQDIPFEYRTHQSFLSVIYERLNSGGFFVTDDHAYDPYSIQMEQEDKFSDMSNAFPIEMPEIAVPDNDRSENAIAALFHNFADKGKASVRYGWYMRIRQKAAPAGRAAAKIEDLLGNKPHTESLQVEEPHETELVMAMFDQYIKRGRIDATGIRDIMLMGGVKSEAEGFIRIFPGRNFTVGNLYMPPLEEIVNSQKTGAAGSLKLFRLNGSDLDPSRFPDKSYDLWYMKGIDPSAYYDADPKEEEEMVRGILAQALRVVRPGGYIVDWSSGFNRKFYEPLLESGHLEKIAEHYYRKTALPFGVWRSQAGGNLSEISNKYRERLTVLLHKALKNVSSTSRTAELRAEYARIIANTLVRYDEASLESLAERGVLSKEEVSCIYSRKDFDVSELAKRVVALLDSYRDVAKSHSVRKKLVSNFFTREEIDALQRRFSGLSINMILYACTNRPQDPAGFLQTYAANAAGMAKEAEFKDVPDYLIDRVCKYKPDDPRRFLRNAMKIRDELVREAAFREIPKDLALRVVVYNSDKSAAAEFLKNALRANDDILRNPAYEGVSPAIVITACILNPRDPASSVRYAVKNKTAPAGASARPKIEDLLGNRPYTGSFQIEGNPEVLIMVDDYIKAGWIDPAKVGDVMIVGGVQAEAENLVKALPGRNFTVGNLYAEPLEKIANSQETAKTGSMRLVRIDASDLAPSEFPDKSYDLWFMKGIEPAAYGISGTTQEEEYEMVRRILAQALRVVRSGGYIFDGSSFLNKKLYAPLVQGGYLEEIAHNLYRRTAKPVKPASSDMEQSSKNVSVAKIEDLVGDKPYLSSFQSGADPAIMFVLIDSYIKAGKINTADIQDIMLVGGVQKEAEGLVKAFPGRNITVGNLYAEPLKDVARSKKMNNARSARLFRLDASDLDPSRFPDNSYDLWFMKGIDPSTYDSHDDGEAMIRRILAQAIRVIRPGGYIFDGADMYNKDLYKPLVKDGYLEHVGENLYRRTAKHFSPQAALKGQPSAKEARVNQALDLQKRFIELMGTGGAFGWSYKGHNVRAEISYDGLGYMFVIKPDADYKKANPELSVLDTLPDMVGVSPSGSFGQISIEIIFINNKPALIIDEVQSSLGYKKIRPNHVRDIYRQWAESAIAEMIKVARKMGIEQIYASTESRIISRYEHVALTPENLWENYVFPFKGKGWEPVAVNLNDTLSGETNAVVWKFVPSTVTSRSSKPGSSDMEAGNKIVLDLDPALRKRWADKIADSFSVEGVKTLVRLYKMHDSHYGVDRLLIADTRTEAKVHSLTLGQLEHLLLIHGLPVERYGEDGLPDIAPIGGLQTLIAALEEDQFGASKTEKPGSSDVESEKGAAPSYAELDRKATGKTLINSVFKGGGAKGVAYAGALEELDARDMWFKEVAGTSAGAITAALIAAGYDSKEIKDIIFETDFNQFKDLRWGVIPAVINLIIFGGMYRGKTFEKWISEKLKAKLGYEPALKDLPIPLTVIASDISHKTLLVLDRNTAPDLKVAEAVRMSMGIPFFFEVYRWIGAYKQRFPAAVRRVVDGGLLSNFPLFVYDDAGRKGEPVVGFMLQEVPHDKKTISGLIGKLFTLLKYIPVFHIASAVIETAMEGQDNRHIEDDVWAKIVNIPVDIGTLDFDISLAKKEELAARGREATKKILGRALRGDKGKAPSTEEKLTVKLASKGSRILFKPAGFSCEVRLDCLGFYNSKEGELQARISFLPDKRLLIKSAAAWEAMLKQLKPSGERWDEAAVGKAMEGVSRNDPVIIDTELDRNFILFDPRTKQEIGIEVVELVSPSKETEKPFIILSLPTGTEILKRKGNTEIAKKSVTGQSAEPVKAEEGRVSPAGMALESQPSKPGSSDMEAENGAVPGSQDTKRTLALSLIDVTAKTFEGKVLGILPDSPEMARNEALRLKDNLERIVKKYGMENDPAVRSRAEILAGDLDKAIEICNDGAIPERDTPQAQTELSIARVSLARMAPDTTSIVFTHDPDGHDITKLEDAELLWASSVFGEYYDAIIKHSKKDFSREGLYQLGICLGEIESNARKFAQANHSLEARLYRKTEAGSEPSYVLQYVFSQDGPVEAKEWKALEENLRGYTSSGPAYLNDIEPPAAKREKGVAYFNEGHGLATVGLLMDLTPVVLEYKKTGTGLQTTLWVKLDDLFEKANAGVSPAGMAPEAEEATLTASLKGLVDATWQEFGPQVGEASSAIAASEMHGQSLILYADDILQNAMVIDLEYTIKNLLAKQNILTGGKVVLYARDARNAIILEKMIKHADPGIATIVITQEQVQASGSEVKEADAILRIARAKGVREMIGLIKGPTSQPEDLAVFAKGASLPIVIVGPEKGVYSFAQAISMVMDAKIHNGATNGWLMMLPPIRAITEDIKLQYEQYLNSLQALVAA